MGFAGIALNAGRVRQVLPLVLGGLCVAALWQKGSDLDWTHVVDTLWAIAWWQWAVALLATGLSFWAIAQYDVVAHRHFGTRIPSGPARNAGAAAIAIGQTTGFGPLVGAAIRWNLIPALSQAELVRLTAFVTSSFFLAWALIALGVCLPLLAGWGWAVPAFVGLTIAALAAGLYLVPRIGVRSLHISLPTPWAGVQIFALAFCDLLFAALVLWILLPQELAITFPTLAAAYALALGAGMLGGTPGGVGPFELALLALLPQADMAALAASLLAYRTAYYAVPCLIGAAWLFLATPEHRRQAPPQAASPTGPRAEQAIALQTQATCIAAQEASASVIATRNTATLFLGPQTGRIEPLLPALARHAQDRNRLPFLYKITARDAARTRQNGWRVWPVAQEAYLDPQRFSLDGAPRRQLRRMLRKADQAGVETRPLTGANWHDLARINADWAAAHGGERGVTMGRFCPGYLSDKPMYGAFHQGRLIAFASAVQSGEAMSLDIMRHVKDLPQGTMHALVHEMITDARARWKTEFCLAAVPHPKLGRFGQADGLARFKRCFAPAWRDLYVGAPSWLALACGAWDMWRSIHHPPELAHEGLQPTPMAQSDETADQTTACLAA